MDNKIKTIGIPHALTYYINDFRWEEFLNILGYETMLSSLSSRKTFDRGFKYATNDQCLPIKTFYGHIIELIDRKPDAIFIPQFISLKATTYGCPLVNAAPLFAKNLSRIGSKIPILMITIDYNYPRLTLIRVGKFALQYAKNPLLARRAYLYYKEKFFAPSQDLFSYKIPGQKIIGVIARSYVINDPFLNNNLFNRLKNMGFSVTTSLSYTEPVDRSKTYFGYRPVHWFNGETLVAVAWDFLQRNDIAGVIFINYFGCGIDAFLEELFKNQLSQNKPYLCLSLDEHTADAGINTRIEAFLDMLIRREKSYA